MDNNPSPTIISNNSILLVINVLPCRIFWSIFAFRRSHIARYAPLAQNKTRLKLYNLCF